VVHCVACLRIQIEMRICCRRQKAAPVLIRIFIALPALPSLSYIPDKWNASLMLQPPRHAYRTHVITPTHCCCWAVFRCLLLTLAGRGRVGREEGGGGGYVLPHKGFLCDF